MRPGGKRTLFVPKDLAPKGVSLPDGVPLEYQIELLEPARLFLASGPPRLVLPSAQATPGPHPAARCSRSSPAIPSSQTASRLFLARMPCPSSFS
eukprot:scaffold10602_cov115-Isochrysis_galbana.AAC.1